MLKRIIVLMVISVGMRLYAQEINPKLLQTVVPVSPNAASLGKYGETPVSLYTGLPSISIPFYEVAMDRLKLPINLSYHAGGNKVEEIASWVGLGWSMGVSGSISRQTRGLPDEMTNGFLQKHGEVMRFINDQMTEAQKITYLQAIDNGEIDEQPDLFTYSINGMSGTFYMDTLGNVITSPKSPKLSISGGGYGGWVVTDLNGNVYEFNEIEFTSTTAVNNFAISPQSTTYTNIPTSWQITKIKNATNTDSLVFTYDTNIYTFNSITAQTKYVPTLFNANAFCSASPTSYYTVNNVWGKSVKKISFKNGEVLFNRSATDRLDLHGDYALESIQVKNKIGELVQSIQLHQHYMVSPGGTSTQSEYYRLILDSVSIKDRNNAVVNKYKLLYNSGVLPNRFSYSQDHWGYYNGAVNTELTPTQTINHGYGTQLIPGANRNPNPSYSQTGMLQKIIYPTGGYSEFEYESHFALAAENIPTIQTTEKISLAYSATSGNLNLSSASFTIPDCVNNGTNTYIYAAISSSTCGGGSQSLDCPIIWLEKVNTSETYNLTTSSSYSIPAGQYILHANLSGVTDQTIIDNFLVQLSWNKCTPVISNSQTMYAVTVGGHRVKSITTSDNTTGVLMKKFYEYKGVNGELTSGKLSTFPKYQSPYYICNPNQLSCSYIAIGSSSNYPLLGTSGSEVGYSYVKELVGTNGANGVNEYFYTNAQNYPDGSFDAFPFPPTLSFDFARGLLIKERTNSVVNNNGTLALTPIQEKRSGYFIMSDNGLFGLKSGGRPGGCLIGGSLNWAAQPFQVHSGLAQLIADTTILYDQNNANSSLSTINNYEYNSNNFLTNKQVSYGTNGKKQTKYISYPIEYATNQANINGDALGIKTLVDKAMHAMPIETITTIKEASGVENVVGATLIVYKQNMPYPDKIYTVDISNPIPLTSFVKSSINTSGTLVKDPNYKLQISFNNYDAQGNLLSQQKNNDVENSYIWDYQSTYPIAQGVNTTVTDMAATSFEADGKGGFTYTGTVVSDANAPTGKKVYNLSSGTIAKATDNTKTYTVSLWATTSGVTVNGAGATKVGRTLNGYTNYEYIIVHPTSITINGTGNIDELRLFPKDAQLVTYTYEPLIGITSQCDGNNRIMYYEYDNFNRLSTVRDQDRNILKKICYTYNGQVENCGQ